MPGGGAVREVTAADGTQVECIDAGSVQPDWHTHDADGAAELLLPAGPGPAVAVAAGAMVSWAVVPACGVWEAGWDGRMVAVREDFPAGSVEEVTAVMAWAPCIPVMMCIPRNPATMASRPTSRNPRRRAVAAWLMKAAAMAFSLRMAVLDVAQIKATG
jgi:hypothetical protein